MDIKQRTVGEKEVIDEDEKEENTTEVKDDGVEEVKAADVEEEVKEAEEEEVVEEESWRVLVEVTPPYLVAGLGMVGAGLLLDTVQHWEVYRELPELFIMVPALIGLKGNLEMTLASRLSTHANLGHLDTIEQIVAMGRANLALLQVQGVVVGALAACLATAMAWAGDPGQAWQGSDGQVPSVGDQQCGHRLPG